MPPTPEAISGVVDMIRAELLEEGEITEDVVSLVVLMEKGNCLKALLLPPLSRNR